MKKNRINTIIGIILAVASITLVSCTDKKQDTSNKNNTLIVKDEEEKKNLKKIKVMLI